MATDPAIGTAIRRARERKRWTQRQLADALGVNVKSVDNWENGRTSPRSSIGAIEVALGISLGAQSPAPPGPLDDLLPPHDDWEATVFSDSDLPDHIKRDLIQRSRASRAEYAAARAARRAARATGQAS